MTTDHDPLHERIREAVAAHGAVLDTTAPDVATLVAGRHRRPGRVLVAATLLVTVIGIAGVTGAAVRDDNADAPVADRVGVDTTPDSTPTTDVGTATTVDGVSPSTSLTDEMAPASYSCTDPLGEDTLGRQLFGSCEPAPGASSGDFACHDRIRSENGFVVFAECEPVGQLGPVPRNDSFDDPDGLTARERYVVQPGDYGLKIAAEFCVTLDDLEAINGWVDVSQEFPGPDTEILIPEPMDQYDDGCGAGLYTVAEDDTTRIGVAEFFCVSVEALDAANAGTDGYSSFAPGLVIIVPPAVDDGRGSC